MIEFGLLGLRQTKIGLIEVGALLHHRIVEPQGMEVVRDVVVKLDRCPVLGLRMDLDSLPVMRSPTALRLCDSATLKMLPRSTATIAH